MESLVWVLVVGLMPAAAAWLLLRRLQWRRQASRVPATAVPVHHKGKPGRRGEAGAPLALEFELDGRRVRLAMPALPKSVVPRPGQELNLIFPAGRPEQARLDRSGHWIGPLLLVMPAAVLGLLWLANRAVTSRFDAGRSAYSVASADWNLFAMGACLVLGGVGCVCLAGAWRLWRRQGLSRDMLGLAATGTLVVAGVCGTGWFGLADAAHCIAREHELRPLQGSVEVFRPLYRMRFDTPTTPSGYTELLIAGRRHVSATSRPSECGFKASLVQSTSLQWRDSVEVVADGSTVLSLRVLARAQPSRR